MGIYVFDADYLYDVLMREVNTPYTSHDFSEYSAKIFRGKFYMHPF